MIKKNHFVKVKDLVLVVGRDPYHSMLRDSDYVEVTPLPLGDDEEPYEAIEDARRAYLNDLTGCWLYCDQNGCDRSLALAVSEDYFLAYEYECGTRSVLPAAYKRIREGDPNDGTGAGELYSTPGRMEGVEYKLVRPVAVVFRGGE